MPVQRRAIIGDYFGNRGGEAFPSSAYGAATTFFGAGSITNLNTQFQRPAGRLGPQLAANNYLFAYGCGAGSYLTIAASAISTPATTPTPSSSSPTTSTACSTWSLEAGTATGINEDKRDARAPRTQTQRPSPPRGRAAALVHAPDALGETIGYNRAPRAEQPASTSTKLTARETWSTSRSWATRRWLHVVAPPATLGHARGLGRHARVDALAGHRPRGYHVFAQLRPNGPFTRPHRHAAGRHDVC